MAVCFRFAALRLRTSTETADQGQWNPCFGPISTACKYRAQIGPRPESHTTEDHTRVQHRRSLPNHGAGAPPSVGCAAADIVSQSDDSNYLVTRVEVRGADPSATRLRANCQQACMFVTRDVLVVLSSRRQQSAVSRTQHRYTRTRGGCAQAVLLSQPASSSPLFVQRPWSRELPVGHALIGALIVDKN
jgi:hypothetical protein